MAMNDAQLQLWNSKPKPVESWRSRMERDAFHLAFPGEGYLEEDEISVFMNWWERKEGYAYSEWTYDPTIHGGFVIEVRWKGKRPRPLKPHQRLARPPVEFSRVKRYENDEAKEFWLELMRKGSR